MPASGRILQQFARYPQPGCVKTRLQASLSPVEACRVHEALLLRTAQTLTAADWGIAELWLDRIETGQSTIAAALALGMRGPYQQSDGDLGQRMMHALEDGLKRAPGVVLVGSDCPVLSTEYLAAAFEALCDADAVLGPSDDGGFVLVGCRRPVGDAFEGVSWGVSTALEATLDGLMRAGLSTALLPTLYDVDTPEDLARWRAESASGVHRGG